MTEDGERIATLEQWMKSHGELCQERQDVLLRKLDGLDIKMTADRAEMRETSKWLHSRMGTHARVLIGAVGTLALSIIGWLATALRESG